MQEAKTLMAKVSSRKDHASQDLSSHCLSGEGSAGKVLITSMDHVKDAIRGKAGTVITA